MADQIGDSFPASAAPALVGRERELATLRAALAAALAGRGALVLIGGEAGIGKTALAEGLLADAAARGACVLVGRCYDLSETPPYGPWAEALARAPSDAALPLLPAAVGPPECDGEALASQDAIARRVRAFLAALAAIRPLVVLIDDLHWADPASLDLVRFLARSIAGLPMLLLAAYRPEELADDHVLSRFLPLLVREARALRLDLLPLDAPAIGALVDARYAVHEGDRARLTGYLVGRTEGNALFLGELLRTLEGEGVLHREGGSWALGDVDSAPVPTLLQQLIAGRAGRLGPETVRLLSAASVIGQAVPLALWATVAGVTEDELLAHSDRATAGQLLTETPDGTGVRFTHALVREALYAGTSTSRRRAWHRRAGEALLATSRPAPDAVAYHLQRAGDPRAVEWLVRAGLRAQGSGAKRTAAARFVAAAGLLAGDAAHDGVRGWLLLLGGQGLHVADTAAALRHLDTAASLARLASDPALIGHICDIRGHVLCHSPHGIRAGVAELERAVVVVEALPPAYRRWSAEQVALARVGALLPAGERPTLPTPAHALPAALHARAAVGRWYGFTGRYREALALGEAGVAAALADDPAAREVPARYGLACAYGALGRPTEARREFALWRTHLYTQNDHYVVEYTLWAELQLAVLPYQADDPPARALLAAEAARAWASAQDTVMAAPYPSQAGLATALLEGRWAEARRLAEAAVALATAGHAQGAGAALGFLARHQGDPDAAWERVWALHPAGPATAPGACLFAPGLALQALAAELALDAGDPASAEAWIAAHGRWLDWSGAVLWRADHLLLRARQAWMVGDPAALAHAEAALARATEPRQPLALLAAHRLLGELASSAGYHADAATHLGQALTLADTCAAPYERALTLQALAELRAAEGEHQAAQEALAEARATFTALGAAPALARADARAARIIATPTAPTPAALPFGLTAREAEVLRLVATGLSDAAVAARLFVSPHTVGSHLRAVYGKLGVTSRAAATRRALEHGLG